MDSLILDALGQAVFGVGPDGRITVWNARAETMLGWSRASICGRDVTDVLPDVTEAELQDIVASGTTRTGLRAIRASDGQDRQVLLTFRPLVDGNEQAAGLAVMVDGDAKYRAIVNNTNEGIWLVDAASKTTFVNARMSEMLGYTAEELMGREVTEYVHPEDRSRNVTKLSERRRGVKETYDLRFLNKSGDVVWALVTASPFYDEGGEFAGAIGMLTDITHRKQAEDRFQGLVNQLDAIVWEGSFNPETNEITFTFVSDQITNLLGYEPSEWTRNVQNWVAAIHEDDRDWVVSACKLSTSRGQDHAMDYRIKTRDGRMMWIRDLVRVSGGTLSGIIFDVTSLREATEAAEEVARLKSAILANMSHELRTPLSGIIGFADVLIEETEGELRELATIIRQGGDRLQLTLDSVLALAQLESGSLILEGKELNVVELVRDVVQLFSRRAAERGLSLSVECDEDDIRAHVDEGGLSRLVSNLIHNSLKFTESGGIVVRLMPKDATFELQVSDTGVGIDPAFLPRIFEEYEQESHGLSRTHEGVGLGLAICNRLVGKMGGTISVESKKGEGSTFTIELPLSVAVPNS